jgi:multidrug transporter EmrE-like cation transporter
MRNHYESALRIREVKLMAAEAGFDKVLPQLKASATKITVNVVRTIIILFVAAQGVEALNLPILTMIVTAIISYLPLVVKATVILVVALAGIVFFKERLSLRQIAGGLLICIALVFLNL